MASTALSIITTKTRRRNSIDQSTKVRINSENVNLKLSDHPYHNIHSSNKTKVQIKHKNHTETDRGLAHAEREKDRERAINVQCRDSHEGRVCTSPNASRVLRENGSGNTHAQFYSHPGDKPSRNTQTSRHRHRPRRSCCS